MSVVSGENPSPASTVAEVERVIVTDVYPKTVSEIFALFRMFRGQEKNGAVAPHSEISVSFVRIRVIRVFTAAFPRRVFGKRDRRATGARSDRA